MANFLSKICKVMVLFYINMPNSFVIAEAYKYKTTYLPSEMGLYNNISLDVNLYINAILY